MLDAILLSFDWKQLLSPDFYIQAGGLWLILFIIFAETGLFVGFFLPGDSLLFIAGIYSDDLARSFIDTGSPFLNLVEIIVLVFLAGVLGNIFGFWFGRKSGPLLFKKKDTWYFKKKHLQQAHDFFEEKGGGALILARFLPIIRTFAPIVAGIVGMERKKFMLYNIIGSLSWATLLLAGGHYLYKAVLKTYNVDLTHHLEYIIIILVVITTAPVLIKMIRGDKGKKSAKGISQNPDPQG